MATVTHRAPKTSSLGEPPSGAGGGGLRNLVPADGRRTTHNSSPAPARTGIWVGLSAITMSFAAFTSALVVGKGSAPDWPHIELPSIVYFNTLALIASSATLEIARRRYTRSGERVAARLWFYATLILGLLFVAGQYVAWSQLRSEGLYLATSPSSSYFYVLTVVHALHVLGGIGGLSRLVVKLGGIVPTLRRSTLDATSYYWHFMGILWLYLLFVLWLKL